MDLHSDSKYHLCACMITGSLERGVHLVENIEDQKKKKRKEARWVKEAAISL